MRTGKHICDECGLDADLMPEVELIGTNRPLSVRPNYSHDWCQPCFSRALSRATGLKITTLDLSLSTWLVGVALGVCAGVAIGQWLP
jgi:hypothetical protein